MLQQKWFNEKFCSRCTGEEGGVQETGGKLGVRGGGGWTLRRASSLWRVLAVTHLHAREADTCAMLRQQLHQWGITIPFSGVIIPRRQLRGVCSGLVPPVHPCQLRTQVAGWRELIHHGAPTL